MTAGPCNIQYDQSMKRILVLFLIINIVFTCSLRASGKHSASAARRILSVREYKDAVYASWIGQIVGNTCGLGYEFKYINQPGPDPFPYGYSWTLDELKRYDGAFSDDDTQWLNPAFIDYHISFAPVKTRGIRITGMAGGLSKDAANEDPGLQYYTSISELRIYSE